jgi:hypothetical protein
LQFKVGVLLYNIWKFVDKFKIDAQPHHMLLHNNDFNFPTKVNRVNYVFLNKAKNNENYNKMIDFQEKYLQ